MSSQTSTSTFSGQPKKKPVAELIADLEKKKGSPISTMQPRKLATWTQVLQSRSMFTTDDSTGQEAERERRLAFSSQQHTTCNEEKPKIPLIYLTTPDGVSMPIDQAPEWKPICISSDKIEESRNWTLSVDLSPMYKNRTEAASARRDARNRVRYLRRALDEQKSRLMFARDKAEATRENGITSPANSFKLGFWDDEALHREAKVTKLEKKLEEAILEVRSLKAVKHHHEKQTKGRQAININENTLPREPRESKWGGIRRQARVKKSIQLGSAPVQSNPLLEAMENDNFDELLRRSSHA